MNIFPLLQNLNSKPVPWNSALLCILLFHKQNHDFGMVFKKRTHLDTVYLQALIIITKRRGWGGGGGIELVPAANPSAPVLKPILWLGQDITPKAPLNVATHVTRAARCVCHPWPRQKFLCLYFAPLCTITMTSVCRLTNPLVFHSVTTVLTDTHSNYHLEHQG